MLLNGKFNTMQCLPHISLTMISWKEEQLKDIYHHVEGPNLSGCEIINFFLTETEWNPQKQKFWPCIHTSILVNALNVFAFILSSFSFLSSSVIPVFTRNAFIKVLLASCGRHTFILSSVWCHCEPLCSCHCKWSNWAPIRGWNWLHPILHILLFQRGTGTWLHG